MGQLGLEPAPIWDTDNLSGSVTHYTIAPIPVFVVVVVWMVNIVNFVLLSDEVSFKELWSLFCSLLHFIWINSFLLRFVFKLYWKIAARISFYFKAYLALSTTTKA